MILHYFALFPTAIVIGMSTTSSPRTQPQHRPKAPLPPPICSTEPGTWAHDTMSRRVNEEILERTWLDNQSVWKDWPTVLRKFQSLRRELEKAAETKLSHLPEPVPAELKEEWREWKEILGPFVDKGDTWLTAPWMVTEFYVYRRLMECLGYFDPDSPGYHYDPFSIPKQKGLESSVTSAEAMLKRMAALPPDTNGLEIAMSVSLWGNKMDLSLWPADLKEANQDVFSEILSSAHDNLLHDDSSRVTEYILQNKCQIVDIIVDNAGFELVTDLALAHFLIESKLVKIVRFQLKSHPTFVSDALEKDLRETVKYYCELDAEKFPHAQAAGESWRRFLATGQWECNEDPFWVQGKPMWEMPTRLQTDLSKRCHLAFVKGDANYRRLLGDLLWDYSTPFDDVVSYFPCPVCALRTLKAELGCGMDASETDRAAALDKDWMVNGRFGVVQFKE